MESNGSRTQIIVAVLALVGVLGAAGIANWDKLFSPSGSKTTHPSQSSTGTASPNIGSIQGDVNINVNKPPPELSVPTFSKDLTSPTQIDELENFIDKHRGKLVRINVNIAEEQSRILDVGGKGVQLASVACTEDKFSDCATSTLLLKGDDYTFGWYKGNNQLSGYFVIDDQVEMHQGPVYGLKGVPRESVLIQTQRGAQR